MITLNPFKGDIDLNSIRSMEDDINKEISYLNALKVEFLLQHGWHKETFQGLKRPEVYWCKDEYAISDIDDVIYLIEEGEGWRLILIILCILTASLA